MKFICAKAEQGIFWIEGGCNLFFDRKRGSIFSTSNKLLNSVNRYVQLTEKDFEKSKGF